MHYCLGSDSVLELNQRWLLWWMTFIVKEMGSTTVLLLLNLLVAFDTVAHSILLDWLRGISIGGTILWWFCPYLHGCVLRVALDEYSLGSVLWGPAGPSAISIYTKPLGAVSRGLWARCHRYMDRVSECGGGLMRANELCLNLEKAESLWLGSSHVQKIGKYLFQIGSHSLRRNKEKPIFMIGP